MLTYLPASSQYKKHSYVAAVAIFIQFRLSFSSCANLLSRIMDREQYYDTDISTSEDVIIDSNVSAVNYDLEPENIPLEKKLQLAIDASMQILQDDQPQENSFLYTITKMKLQLQSKLVKGNNI